MCIRKSAFGLLTSGCLATLVRNWHSRILHLEVSNPNADFKSEISVGLKAREKSASQMSTSVRDRTSPILKPIEGMATSVLFRSLECKKTLQAICMYNETFS